MADKIERIIADTFLQMAEGLETGNFGKKPKIALTGMGSEHGEENAMEAAKMAAKDGIEVYYIGTLEAEGVTTVKVANDEEGHKKMEELLASQKIDGAVTMHFPFPIGVSTVGRVVTPAKGKEMFIANTTGTSSADRIEGMIKNTIYGMITAKACGLEHPTVGILNVDGARQTEIALKELKKNGYDITFAESARADGGCVMRGNDVLQGTPDIMVCDSLTGNIMVKMLSSYTTGGSFEASGYGYGPGIGEDYEQLVINETIDGLFSSYRIDRNSLPKGFFLYEIRWDDSLSSLAEICPSVVVNHAGSFITKSPLEFDANNSIRITYANFIEFCQFGEWAYEKLAVLDCNSGNVAVISPDRRLQTAEEIEIFLSEHCGYHLSEINWMVMKGDVVFLNENDF